MPILADLSSRSVRSRRRAMAQRATRALLLSQIARLTAPLHELDNDKDTVLSPGSVRSVGLDQDSLDEWGRTIIRVGRAHNGKTYAQVATDIRYHRYLQWMRDDHPDQIADIVDFAAYLVMSLPASEAGPMIPGTDRPRICAPP